MAINKKDEYSQGDREGYYLLSVNYAEKTHSVRYFRKSDIVIATEAYENFEKEYTTKANTVLVSASSVATLKKAYPNYFADVSEFITKVRELTGDYPLNGKQLPVGRLDKF